MKNLFPLLAATPLLALAQQTPPATPQTPPPDAKPAATVEINGSRSEDTDLRRLSTASKLIFGREELDRNGDTSLGDVLKRLPGVTLGGRPGRGGEIRMRGLGNGYTQILVNGERPPQGFSMDSLSPDQVERVEIIRGALAEHSTRAIAGTINIVLRESYQAKNSQLKLSDTFEQGRQGPNVSFAYPGKLGDVNYLLNMTVGESRQHDESRTHNQDVTTAGVVQRDQQLHDTSDRTNQMLHLAPRLSWKGEDGNDTVNFQPFLMANRNHGTSFGELDQSVGVLAPDYATAGARFHGSSDFLRGFGNWQHKLEGSAKLDVRLGFGVGHSDTETTRNQYDAGGTLKDQLFDTDATHDHGLNTGGKLSLPLGDGSLLGAGWELEMSHRSQTKVSLDNGLARFPQSGDNLTADTRRAALFVQDEWDISKQVAAYAGVRWEGIRVETDSASIQNTNSSSVWSPVLHGVYRFAESTKDQIRASVSNTYKAPAVGDLIALPSLSRLNSATQPDRTGNPDLKPELARGLDFAYEHYIARSGVISIGGFARHIRDLQRRVTTLEDTPTGPRWVSRPQNIGSASTRGLELEAKFTLPDVIENAPAIDLRANLSRFWSSVDGLPGPNNRLDGQARMTANVGADWRVKGLPLTLGANLNWTPETTVQAALNEVDTTGDKRQIDAYALWRFNPDVQLRVSASNMLARDALSGRVVQTGDLLQTADTAARTYMVFGLRLEMKI